MWPLTFTSRGRTCLFSPCVLVLARPRLVRQSETIQGNFQNSQVYAFVGLLVCLRLFVLFAGLSVCFCVLPVSLLGCLFVCFLFVCVCVCLFCCLLGCRFCGLILCLLF